MLNIRKDFLQGVQIRFSENYEEHLKVDFGSDGIRLFMRPPLVRGLSKLQI